jgi:Curli production assembly/transport component CsgG
MAIAGAWSCDVLGADAPDQTSASGSKPAVAVMQFEAAGASAVEASAATDRMQEELFALGKYTLVDRAQINEILKEQAFQQTGCTSTECAVRVGRILGVRVLATGKVTRLDETHWLISASMTDAETAETLRSTSIQYEGAYFDLLRDGMPILAARVAGVTPPEEPGFVARIIDSVAGPNATMAGREKVVPKSGFAIFTGYNYQNGSLHLKSGGTLNYSGSGVPNLGLEYQWVLATPYTLSAYAEIGFGALSGDLTPYYDTIDTSEFGLELRYWMTSRAFVGGRIASFNSEFYDSRDLSDAMNLAGTSVGASAGYEWDRGLYIKAALDFAVVSTGNVKIQANTQSPPASVSGNGEAFSFWGDVGYRWK